MDIIIINNGDGSCDVGIPNEDWLSVKGNTLTKFKNKITLSGKTSRVVDSSVLPTDRDFRNAWTDDEDGDQIDIDMPRARIIHMDKIRVKRDLKMLELDIETMRGLEVQPEKQVLRDIPQNFDLSVASTPEELKNLWPEELK